tara:strand:- start:172 stop:384 length:213 start_codon:yes stop_codon:yes gene_type:complete
MTTQKTNIQIGNEVIELTGEDLTAFKAQRTKDQSEAKKRQAEADAKIASRESALAKLADLGLTAEEVASL